MSNELLKQLKENVKQHYESDSIIQMAKGIFKYNKYLSFAGKENKSLANKKYGVINVLEDRYNFENFILKKSDIEKNETGDNLTLWDPFFFVTSETNENDIDLNNYRMAIRHNQSNGENNIKCKLTLRNNKYKLEEVPDGKISAKKVGKYNIYEFFMGEIGEITHSELEVDALKEAEAATERANVAEGQLAETEKQLTKETVRAAKELIDANKRADDAKAELDTANKELGETTEELERTTKLLETSEKNLNEAKAKITEAEEQQKKAEQELKDAANEEDKQIVKQKLEEAKRKKKELEANRANIKARNENLKKRQLKSQKQLKKKLEQQKQTKEEREKAAREAREREEAKAEDEAKAATKIQAIQRGYSKNKKFKETLNMIKMIKKIQAVRRGILTRREQKQFNDAVTKIQALQRGRHVRKEAAEVEAKEAAATTIQSIYRRLKENGTLSGLKEAKRTLAATAIQAQQRGRQVRKEAAEEKLVEDIKQFLVEAMSKVEDIINTEMEESQKKNSIEEIKTKISDLLGNPSADILEEVKQYLI